MTRKEEIEQAAENTPMDIYEKSIITFIKGAEWADEHPSEANIAMYLGKKGWPLSTYGIPTYEEASKTLDEYYEYKKKQWFDKACKWIENGCVFTDIDGSKIVNTEMYKTIIEDFRKEMESS